jgi:hypothetical protein
MSIMFSCSSTFRFTLRTAQRLTLGKEAFFAVVLANTSEYFDRAFVVEYIVAGILQQQQIRLPLQYLYISTYSSQGNDMFTVTLGCTRITARADCIVGYLTCYWRFYVSKTRPTPAQVPYTTAPDSANTADLTDV